MNNDLLLIHRSILPDNYLQVIETRELIETEKLSISDACKKIGISRNTYYKYKDYVFRPSNDLGKKAILSFKVEDIKGVLSNIISQISSFGGNIITINQEVPIQHLAYLVITINTMELNSSLIDLVNNLKKVKGVKVVSIVAYE